MTQIIMLIAGFAWKKNPEIAVGNVVGSSIFNITFILGISAIIQPLPFPQHHNIDVGITAIASKSASVYIHVYRWEKDT